MKTKEKKAPFLLYSAATLALLAASPVVAYAEGEVPAAESTTDKPTAAAESTTEEPKTDNQKTEEPTTETETEKPTTETETEKPTTKPEPEEASTGEVEDGATEVDGSEGVKPAVVTSGGKQSLEVKKSDTKAKPDQKVEDDPATEINEPESEKEKIDDQVETLKDKKSKSAQDKDSNPAPIVEDIEGGTKTTSKLVETSQDGSKTTTTVIETIVEFGPGTIPTEDGATRVSQDNIDLDNLKYDEDGNLLLKDGTKVPVDSTIEIVQEETKGQIKTVKLIIETERTESKKQEAKKDTDSSEKDTNSGTKENEEPENETESSGNPVQPSEEQQKLVDKFFNDVNITSNYVVYADEYSSSTHVDGNICVNKITGNKNVEGSKYFEAIKVEKEAKSHPTHSYIKDLNGTKIGVLNANSSQPITIITETNITKQEILDKRYVENLNGGNVQIYSGYSESEGAKYQLYKGADQNNPNFIEEADAKVLDERLQKTGSSNERFLKEIKIDENLSKLADSAEKLRQTFAKGAKVTTESIKNGFSFVRSNAKKTVGEVFIMNVDTSVISADANDDIIHEFSNFFKGWFEEENNNTKLILNVVNTKDEKIVFNKPLTDMNYHPSTERLIWNFGDYAGPINVQMHLNGVVVAPNAIVNQNMIGSANDSDARGTWDGRVIAKSFSHSMEIHQPSIPTLPDIKPSDPKPSDPKPEDETVKDVVKTVKSAEYMETTPSSWKKLIFRVPKKPAPEVPEKPEEKPKDPEQPGSEEPGEDPEQPGSEDPGKTDPKDPGQPETPPTTPTTPETPDDNDDDPTPPNPYRPIVFTPENPGEPTVTVTVEPMVLGANRDAQPAVLGAERPQPQVLGADRDVKTGDAGQMAAYAVLSLFSMSGLAFWKKRR